MIIFGSRTKSAFIAAMIFVCAQCHGTAAQRLFRIRTWFTLFFVPMFPFGHGRYVMQCSYCGSQTALDRESAERFEDDAEIMRQEALRAESFPTPEATTGTINGQSTRHQPPTSNS